MTKQPHSHCPKCKGKTGLGGDEVTCRCPKLRPLRDQLAAHNRSVSWTFSRAGREGTEVSKETVDFMFKKTKQLEDQIKALEGK
jgi:hypothetical protein